MNVIEKANFWLLCVTGGYAVAIGIVGLFTVGPTALIWGFGFAHPPPTFIIAGAGLIGLVWKYKLYALPLFLIATQIIENPWVWTNPNWDVIELVILSLGVALCRPSFKQPLYVVIAVLFNMIDFPIYSQWTWPFFHHGAEIVVFTVFLFNVKALRSPWS